MTVKQEKIIKIFTDKYPEIKDAYGNNDIKFSFGNPVRRYNKGNCIGIEYMISCEIRSKVILEWFINGFLRKSPDQRGSETDTDMSPVRLKDWNYIQIDEMSGAVRSEFVFSFGPHWNDGWITNGGHRLNHDKRFMNEGRYDDIL